MLIDKLAIYPDDTILE